MTTAAEPPRPRWLTMLRLHKIPSDSRPSPVVQIAALLVAFVFLLPFLVLVTTSLKTLPEATAFPPTLLPDDAQWGNFKQALVEMDFLRYLLNTLLVCGLNVCGTVLSCAMAAWAFAHFRFRGSGAFFALTLATMMIPFPVLMVPQYAIFRELGWIGTFKPLWVPAWFGVAYNIFLLRQFFLSIPRTLTEAARIDGCGEIRIFVQLVLPLSRSALLVVALFTFMYHWNDFMAPLIFLTDDTQFTLALGLQAFQTQLGGVEVNLLMAATLVMILPVTVLFFLCQKSFMQGISLTGLKE